MTVVFVWMPNYIFVCGNLEEKKTFTIGALRDGRLLQVRKQHAGTDETVPLLTRGPSVR